MKILFNLAVVFCFCARGFQQVPERDPYALLGVSRSATDEEIKKAYRRMALKFHPDKQKDQGSRRESEIKFKELGNAYSVLTDPEKRRSYNYRNPSATSRRDGTRTGQTGWEGDPYADESEGLDPYGVFNGAFGKGFTSQGVTVTFENGEFRFSPRGHSGQRSQSVPYPLQDALDGDDEESDFESLLHHRGHGEAAATDGGVNVEDQVDQVAAMFPKTDRELVRDVLGHHRGNVQTSVNTLMEMQGSVLGHLEPTSPIGASKTTSSEGSIWEKLESLHAMFPDYDEDVVYEILLYSKGDMNSSIDACLRLRETKSTPSNTMDHRIADQGRMSEDAGSRCRSPGR